MHRFRSIWLALMGGAVIVTLSLSVALGADPADETDGNRGQTISGFVHSLIFAQDDPADDETVDEDQDEDEDSDEDTEEDSDEADEADEDLDEDTEEDADEADEADEEDTEGDSEAREVPEEFANHGECVSEAANKATSRKTRPRPTWPTTARGSACTLATSAGASRFPARRRQPRTPRVRPPPTRTRTPK